MPTGQHQPQCQTQSSESLGPANLSESLFRMAGRARAKTRGDRDGSGRHAQQGGAGRDRLRPPVPPRSAGPAEQPALPAAPADRTTARWRLDSIARATWKLPELLQTSETFELRYRGNFPSPRLKESCQPGRIEITPNPTFATFRDTAHTAHPCFTFEHGSKPLPG